MSFWGKKFLKYPEWQYLQSLKDIRWSSPSVFCLTRILESKCAEIWAGVCKGPTINFHIECKAETLQKDSSISLVPSTDVLLFIDEHTKDALLTLSASDNWADVCWSPKINFPVGCKADTLQIDSSIPSIPRNDLLLWKGEHTKDALLTLSASGSWAGVCWTPRINSPSNVKLHVWIGLENLVTRWRSRLNFHMSLL